MKYEEISETQVLRFIELCEKAQLDCLDGYDWAMCKSCSRVVMAIAFEAVAAAATDAASKEDGK